jgi:hypothetical protein
MSKVIVELDNLEIVTARENSNKKHLKSSSKYIGVCFEKESKKWVASISLKGKQKKLGRFDCEIKASEAYQNALKTLL